MSQHKPMQYHQEANIPVHAFLKRLKQIIKQCEYKPIVEETNLVDLFIFELHLRLTQNSLVKEDKELTIAMALCIAEIEEVTNKQVEALHIPLKKANAHAVQANYDREYVQTCRFCSRGHENGE